jgi:catechol 2,3-dioxygenase-like lactoylglutathione lyase family enzyme
LTYFHFDIKINLADSVTLSVDPPLFWRNDMNAVTSAPRPHAGAVNKLGLLPKMLNHAAFVTHDSAATVDFYTNVMGMEFVSTIIDDVIPSTGDPFPYFHIFFRLADGSTMAFFESPGLPPAAQPTHPAYDIFNHIAFQVDSREEIERWRDWLVSKGIAVVGPTNHKGLLLSIYFHDPNGLRLELTTPLGDAWNSQVEQARHDLMQWESWKDEARRKGRPVDQVLVERIKEARKRYENAPAAGAPALA